MNALATWLDGAATRWRIRDEFVLAALCLLCLASGAWHAPLFDLDEGAFSQATLEMHTSGNWLTTTLDGAPRYDKPILTYWLQSLGVMLLGVTELAFRLPSLLAAFAWVFATWHFVRNEGGAPDDAQRRATALFAAGSLATALMVGVVAHAATADALLNLWLALTFFDLWRWLRHDAPAALTRAYLWIGFGMLTKGPIAAALPLAVGLAFCLCYGRMRDASRALLHWRGWIVSLVVIGAWLVPLALTGNLDFVWQFLMQHNVGRFEEAAESHGGGPWYYLVWLPIVVLPHTGLLPGALGRARQWRDDPLATFALLWLAIVFVLFSFSSTKLPHYILYGCTPVFVLFGRAAADVRHRAVLVPGTILVAVLVLAPVWLPLIHVPERRAFEHGILALARERLDASFMVSAVAASGLAIAAWLLPRPTWQRLLVLGAAQGVIVWTAIVPLVAAAQQEPVREAGLLAAHIGAPVVRYKTNLPSFSVYRGHSTPNGIPHPGELVFVRRDRVAGLRTEATQCALVTEYERGGVALLRCVEPGAAPAAPGAAH